MSRKSKRDQARDMDRVIDARLYFAGQALAAFAKRYAPEDERRAIARDCYLWAEIMLEEGGVE